MDREVEDGTQFLRAGAQSKYVENGGKIWWSGSKVDSKVDLSVTGPYP
jgi:hypothetical protein